MMQRLLAFIILAFCSISFADSNSVKMMPSLEWQKQNLEQNIHSKIDRILKSVINSNQYNIDVEVLTKSQPEPQFYDSQKKNKPLGNLNTAGDITKSESVEKKNSELAADEPVKSNAKIKFDDVNPTEESEDIVTFSKFGIQAPLVDDFRDFQPDGKIVLTMQSSGDESKIEKMKEEFKKKEDELNNKIKEIQAANDISPVEQMWKYNNSVDVFKNLKAVNITIRLSTALSSEVKQAVKSYVNSIKFNLGKVIPVVKFENALLGADTDVPTKEDKIKEILDYFGKFSTLFGVIFGVILLGMIGKSLINKFFELSAAQSNSQTVRLEGQQDNNSDDEDSNEPGSAIAGGGGDGSPGELSDEYCGVERFKTYSKTSINDATLLVKNWLQANSKDSNAALRALVQQMENGELTQVFAMLTDRERNEWKNLLSKPLTTSELAAANKFISNEVVQNIIIPNVITDPETYDLIIKITPEQVSELIETKPEISSVLLNVLNTNFLNKVLSFCDEEKRNSIVDSAFEIREEDIINSQDNLKTVLKDYVHSFDKIPFIDKVVTILPDATLDIEKSLYEKLYANTSIRRIKEVAMLSFPSFLISSFDEKSLKTLLSDYDLENKVKMLLTIDEDIKTKFMDTYAPSGSKANDLLTLEFENYEKEEREMEKLRNDKNAHWKRFVEFVRKRISKDKEMLTAAEEVVETWSATLEGESHDNVETLRAA